MPSPQEIVFATIYAPSMVIAALMPVRTVECVIEGGMPSTFQNVSFDQYSVRNLSITVSFLRKGETT